MGLADTRARQKEARQVTISEFQRQIERTYLERDRRRGLDADFRWFVEEVGELAEALRRSERGALANEFADVFAWLSTMASIAGVELEEAVRKYAGGCPKCGEAPCGCPEGTAGDRESGIGDGLDHR